MVPPPSPRFDRRRLLGAGALAAGALLLPRTLHDASEPVTGLADTAGVRRMIALGPAGVIYPGSTQDYRAAGTAGLFRETGTRWVRMWADWPSLMPGRGRLDARRLAALDQQIARARMDGLRVVLTSYRVPGWAGGGPDLLRPPRDMSPASDWGAWIRLLLTRYRDGLDGLEVASEPNHQWRPRAGAHRVVAGMLRSAEALAAEQPGGPLVMGPGTADDPGCESFVRGVLDELQAAGFRGGPRFAWTHHNYGDVVGDRGDGAARVRRLLVGRWAGWPHGDPGDPRLFITEGGAPLQSVARHFGLSDPQAQRAKQAELLARNWGRMTSAEEGAGVAMVANYLLYSDPSFDSGLCDPSLAGGARRPALAAWMALPSVA